MAHDLVGFLAGSLFSLCVSGLADPAVILGFLDLAGARNLTLFFVMAAGLNETLIGCRVAFAPGHPQWSSQFGVPTATAIDTLLVSRAVIFGIDWGLADYCPGPVACPRQREGVISFAAIAMIAVRLRRVRWSALPTGVRLNQSVASLRKAKQQERHRD
jgi:uncharacterized protein